MKKANQEQITNYEIKGLDFTKRFETIPNYHLYDKRLTLTEKGFLTMLYTLPKKWKITKRATSNHFHISERSFINYMNKLKEIGYISLIKSKNNKTIYKLNARPTKADFNPTLIDQYTLQQLNVFLNDERIEQRFKDLIKNAISQAQKNEDEFNKMLDEYEQEYKEPTSIDDELPF